MLSEYSDEQLQQIIDDFNPFAVYEYSEDYDSEFSLVLRAAWELEKREISRYIRDLSGSV